MGIWRQKQEESKSIWFRVPASLKKEFEELRQQAEAEGMDAGATFTAALWRLAKQLLRNCRARPSTAMKLAAGQGERLTKRSGGGQRTSAAS